MSDPTAIKRQLTIKANVVKRLAKEEVAYEKEAEDQRKKVDKMVEEGKDEYDVKKQREVLQDCLQMIPDCQKRLASAVGDLKSLVESLDTSLAETEEYKKAFETISELASPSASS